ncbi:MAG: tyrosine-protein phosphatase [Caenibius sp.]
MRNALAARCLHWHWGAMEDGRITPLEGVHNFRDYGGYGVTNGGRLRKGLLFRSGQHTNATDRDLATIGAIPFAAIVDLRGGPERASYPCRRAPGFAGEVFFDDRDSASLPPHLQGDLASMNEDEMRERMRENYRGLPFRSSIATMLKTYFDVLGKAEGPSLIHCFAGKDRTGISVALLHKLAGVHPDDIMHDYLLTNEASDRRKHMEEIGEFMQSRWGKMSEAGLYVMSGVYPEWLDAAFDSLLERCGSFDAFFAERVGIDDARREAILARLIES